MNEFSAIRPIIITVCYYHQGEFFDNRVNNNNRPATKYNYWWTKESINFKLPQKYEITPAFSF